MGRSTDWFSTKSPLLVVATFGLGGCGFFGGPALLGDEVGIEAEPDILLDEPFFTTTIAVQELATTSNAAETTTTEPGFGSTTTVGPFAGTCSTRDPALASDDTAAVTTWHSTDLDGDGSADRWGVALEAVVAELSTDGVKTIERAEVERQQHNDDRSLDLDGNGRMEAVVDLESDNAEIFGLLTYETGCLKLLGTDESTTAVFLAAGGGRPCLGVCTAGVVCSPQSGHGIIEQHQSTPLAAEDYNQDGVINGDDLAHYLDNDGDPADLAQRWTRTTWVYDGHVVFVTERDDGIAFSDQLNTLGLVTTVECGQ